MAVKCPYCGRLVEPTPDATGALWCPACGNTGRVAPPAVATPAAPPAPAGLPPPPASPAAPGIATAALVVGIAALVLIPLSIVLGPVAVVLGVKALGRLKRMPPGTPGQGFAVAGVVLGGIGILVGITVVMAAVVFVLVSNLADLEGPQFTFDVEAAGAGGTLTVLSISGYAEWEDYEPGGTARCELPRGQVEAGDRIVCVTDGTVELVDWSTGEVVYATAV